MHSIILASSSVYRKKLLQQLVKDFLVISPNIDEEPLPSETAIDLVKRLSVNKAKKIGLEHKALIIGSDQVSVCRGRILSKPLSLESGIEQLVWCSDQTVELHSGLSLFNSISQQTQSEVVSARILFKKLTKKMIENYLRNEADALHCAGSCKFEGLGILLIEKIQCDDPNAIIGLPLIALNRMLLNESVRLL